MVREFLVRPLDLRRHLLARAHGHRAGLDFAVGGGVEGLFLPPRRRRRGGGGGRPLRLELELFVDRREFLLDVLHLAEFALELPLPVLERRANRADVEDGVEVLLERALHLLSQEPGELVHQRHQEEAEGQAQSRNLELINSVAKLRLAGAESSAARWWGKEFQKIVELENALDAKEATTALLKAVIPNLGTLLVYIVITRLIAEAAASPSLSAPNVGQLLGFFSAFGTFIGAAAGFSGLLIGAFDMPVIYERARPIVETATETAELKEEAGDLNGHIQLDRVSYRYAPELPLVLDGVSLEVRSGEQMAIVGPSGSGKSTLVRLLLGFANPENGEIRFDGQPLNGLPGSYKSLLKDIDTLGA